MHTRCSAHCLFAECVPWGFPSPLTRQPRLSSGNTKCAVMTTNLKQHQASPWNSQTDADLACWSAAAVGGGLCPNRSSPTHPNSPPDQKSFLVRDGDNSDAPATQDVAGATEQMPRPGRHLSVQTVCLSVQTASNAGCAGNCFTLGWRCASR